MSLKIPIKTERETLNEACMNLLMDIASLKQEMKNIDKKIKYAKDGSWLDDVVF